MDASFGIGAGANVVGGIMQSIAATQAKHAMDATFRRELQRQQRYQNEAFNTFQPAIQERGVETARNEIEAGSQKRQDFYNKVAQSPLALGQVRSPRATAGFKLMGQNRANLGGYSDWALEQMIKSIRSQDELNRISNFAGGMANVFPMRMQDAQHAGDELAFWGNLVSSIGGSAGGWGDLFNGGTAQRVAPGYGSSFMGDVNKGTGAAVAGLA